MPEMHFHIRWPDGTSETCYSPSLVIKDYFTVGDDAIRSPISWSAAALRSTSRASGCARNTAGRAAAPSRSWPALKAPPKAFASVPDALIAVDAFED